MDGKGYGTKRSLANLRYCPDVFLQELMKITRKLMGFPISGTIFEPDNFGLRSTFTL
jgi:hypothetical protein